MFDYMSDFMSQEMVPDTYDYTKLIQTTPNIMEYLRKQFKASKSPEFVKQRIVYTYNILKARIKAIGTFAMHA